jgi:hypothetical protein
MGSFKVDPTETCVKLAGREYRFTCRYKGGELTVNGREAEGDEKATFFPKMDRGLDSDGWCVENGGFIFPREGVWRMLYWVGDDLVAKQTIVTGSPEPLKLSRSESAALKAKLP